MPTILEQLTITKLILIGSVQETYHPTSLETVYGILLFKLDNPAAISIETFSHYIVKV